MAEKKSCGCGCKKGAEKKGEGKKETPKKK